MEDKIKTWLNAEGYPLELFVYNKLVERQYICEKSPIYNDIETDTKREIDIVATLASRNNTDYAYELTLLIECKKSNDPLLLLSTLKFEERYKQLLGWESDSYEGIARTLAFHDMSDQPVKELSENIGCFSEIVPYCYSLIPAFKNSDSIIYKGIIGLSKAYDFYQKDFLNLFNSIVNDKRTFKDDFLFCIHMPLLVVDSPLYIVSTDTNGSLDLTSTNWGSLNFIQPWSFKGIYDYNICNIQVIRKEFINEALDSIEKFFSFISKQKFLDPAVKSLKSKRRKKCFLPFINLFNKLFNK